MGVPSTQVAVTRTSVRCPGSSESLSLSPETSKSTRRFAGPGSYSFTQYPSSGTAVPSETAPSSLQCAVTRPPRPLEVRTESFCGAPDGSAGVAAAVATVTGWLTRAPAAEITVQLSVEAPATMTTQITAIIQSFRPATRP
jgi:hypothetical protein